MTDNEKPVVPGKVNITETVEKRPSHHAVTWTFRVLIEKLYSGERFRIESGTVDAQTDFAARHKASALTGIAPEHIAVEESSG